MGKNHRRRGKPNGKVVNWLEIEKDNALYTAYYGAQGLFSDPAEMETMKQAFREELPTTFRFTGNRASSQELVAIMKDQFFGDLTGTAVVQRRARVEPATTDVATTASTASTADSSTADSSAQSSPVPVDARGPDAGLTTITETVDLAPPVELPWYPDGLGWQFNCSKGNLRKVAPVTAFRNFLVAETEVGNISRQEAVSMVPPLFLDVQPGHIVLDMCAAPGSKTAQILEAIDQADSGDLLQGMVVANDADYERAHMLVRQSKRLHSPTLIVTCHDAQFLPSIRGTRASGRVVQFDRILADVPCSGDGTLRKNKQIWSSWNPKNGNALHRLQLLIAERGARLLKIGGRMVYSTCSLNPSENESVIAELIWITGGALRLVDVSRELPALKRAPGLTTWKVMSPKEVLYERWDDVPEADRNRTVFPTLFPPPNAAELHLERAMRIYPHYQDTGGFFVAVLEKVSEFGQMDQISTATATASTTAAMATAASPTAADAVNADDAVDGVDIADARVPECDGASVTPQTPEAKRPKLDDEAADAADAVAATSENGTVAKAGGKRSRSAKPSKEDEFVFLDPVQHATVMSDLRSQFALHDTFPFDQCLVRTTSDSVRNIYIVSRAAKEAIQTSNENKLRIVNSGVCVFKYTRTSDKNIPCYRFSSDGLTVLKPFLGADFIVSIPRVDFLLLLSAEGNPLFTAFSPAFQADLQRRNAGSYILRYTPSEADEGHVRLPIEIPIYRAPMSLGLLVDKHEKKSILHRIGGGGPDL